MLEDYLPFKFNNNTLFIKSESSAVFNEKILNKGENVSLITDAGTPGISAPAYKLIRKAIEIGCKIESIPGPSAVVASLVSSGLPTDRFIF